MANHKLKSPAERRRGVFAKVRRGLVGIAVIPQQPNGGLNPSQIQVIGSGFIVDAAGIIVTARHVLQPWIDAAKATGKLPPPPSAMVVTDGEIGPDGNCTWDCRLLTIADIASSNNVDLAVAKISTDPKHQLTALRLADEPCCEGDVVAACGYPFGMELHAKYVGNAPIAIPSFTQGIVSAIIPHPDTPRTLKHVFQLDAMINAGNSGGPVFDVETGDVVGIVSERMHATAASVVQRPPHMQGPAGQMAPPVESLVDIEMPIGRANIVHAHHVRQLIADLKRSGPGQSGRTP